MNDFLFENIDKNEDSLWIIKEFFNSINTMLFPQTIKYLFNRISYGDEYSSCDFPDDLECGEDSFEGVKFSYQDEERVVTDKVFKEYLDLACERYIKKNPEKKHEIEESKKLWKNGGVPH